MNQNLEGFMKELAKLSKKYGYKIDGCGCCGSPSADYFVDDKSTFANENISTIEWMEEKQTYKGNFYNYKTKERFVYEVPKDE